MTVLTQKALCDCPEMWLRSQKGVCGDTIAPRSVFELPRAAGLALSRRLVCTSKDRWVCCVDHGILSCMETTDQGRSRIMVRVVYGEGSHWAYWTVTLEEGGLCL